MLVGKEGRYQKPTHPCVVPGCTGLSFQADKGACKKHMFDMIDWLRRRVCSRPSIFVPILGKDDPNAHAR